MSPRDSFATQYPMARAMSAGPVFTKARPKIPRSDVEGSPWSVQRGLQHVLPGYLVEAIRTLPRQPADEQLPSHRAGLSREESNHLELNLVRLGRPPDRNLNLNCPAVEGIGLLSTRTRCDGRQHHRWYRAVRVLCRQRTIGINA